MASAETSIIELLREQCPAAGAGVCLGIGDDAAVTSLPEGSDLVTATDMLVEGTHFLPGTDAASVGHKVLAVNLSDLAAMGAEPRWASIALALPDADLRWVAAFAAGFGRLAAQYGVVLIGGDTVRGPRSVTVTLQGVVPTDRAIGRGGARSGDAIFVSGSAGHAAAGCQARLGKLRLPPAAQDYLRAFEYPQPRVELGLALRERVTAMIDVSDGVHTDLSRLLRSSGCGAELELPSLDGLSRDFGSTVAEQLFLHGGEDYELLFTANGDAVAAIEVAAATAGVPLTRLGTVTEREGLRWLRAGRPVAPGEGFEHFGGAA